MFFISVLLSGIPSAAQAKTGGRTTIGFLVNYADYFSSYQKLDIAGKYKKYWREVELTVDYQNYPLDDLKPIGPHFVVY